MQLPAAGGVFQAAPRNGPKIRSVTGTTSAGRLIMARTPVSVAEASTRRKPSLAACTSFAFARPLGFATTAPAFAGGGAVIAALSPAKVPWFAFAFAANFGGIPQAQSSMRCSCQNSGELKSLSYGKFLFFRSNVNPDPNDLSTRPPSHHYEV